MSRAAAVALLLVAGPAFAVEPTHAEGTAAEVARAVAGALPPGLALVDVWVPEKLREAGGATVSVGWPFAPHAGRMDVLVTLRDREREARGWARIELRPLRPVLVAARTLRAGATIARGDLALEPRPAAVGASPSDGGFHIDPDALVGAPVLRAVHKGAVLTDADVVRPPPVPRGTPIRILVRRGAVLVSATGLLDQPARPGEPAVARSTDGHRLVHGRLVDRETLSNEGDEP